MTTQMPARSGIADSVSGRRLDDSRTFSHRYKRVVVVVGISVFLRNSSVITPPRRALQTRLHLSSSSVYVSLTFPVYWPTDWLERASPKINPFGIEWDVDHWRVVDVSMLTLFRVQFRCCQQVGRNVDYRTLLSICPWLSIYLSI